MANAPNTQSTLSYDTSFNSRNRTSTSISTNIIIMVGKNPVGAVQSMSISEKRGIKQIDEVGTDGHVDSVPNASTNITGSCDRIRFDRLRIAEAFFRGFVHVASQAYPFDIVIIDKQSRDSGNQISTIIRNVWIDGIDYAYTAGDWIITDKMTWQAERIYSILNNGSSDVTSGGNPVAMGGTRKIEFEKPSSTADGTTFIERLADTGTAGRGGSLDAAGLIDIGSTGNYF